VSYRNALLPRAIAHEDLFRAWVDLRGEVVEEKLDALSRDLFGRTVGERAPVFDLPAHVEWQAADVEVRVAVYQHHRHADGRIELTSPQRGHHAGVAAPDDEKLRHFRRRGLSQLEGVTSSSLALKPRTFIVATSLSGEIFVSSNSTRACAFSRLTSTFFTPGLPKAAATVPGQEFQTMPLTSMVATRDAACAVIADGPNARSRMTPIAA
jgi:hypothetical protein